MLTAISTSALMRHIGILAQQSLGPRLGLVISTNVTSIVNASAVGIRFALALSWQVLEL